MGCGSSPYTWYIMGVPLDRYGWGKIDLHMGPPGMARHSGWKKNAGITDESSKKYRKLFSKIQATLTCLRAICMVNPRKNFKKVLYHEHKIFTCNVSTLLG